MDWNLKMPPWDLAELDHTVEQNLGSVVAGPSGGPALRRPGPGLECSVDLKLGGVGDPGSSYKWKEQPRTPSSTAAPPKRQRGLGIASLNVLCLVDGCKADLSKCREYHRRHKVCEVHSKTPVVVVGGQEQRFCQQCSRFHLLVEFDEVKRSCRKHLDGHNRRRRKLQPNSGNSGTRNLANPQFFPTTTTEPNWAGILKAEDNTIYMHSTASDLPFCPSSSYSYNSKERKQYPFLQESETSLSSITTLGSLVGQSHLMTTSTSTISGVVGSKMFSSALTPALHSDCALSLLSSPTTHSSGIDLGHRMPSSADRIPMAQPLVSSLQYGDLTRYSHLTSKNVPQIGYSYSVIGDEHTTAILVSDASEAGVHCPNIFQIGGGEGSSDGASQALPFSWQ